MSKISPAKPEEVVRMLNKLGFQKIRQSGSHAVFRHSNGRWATVPLHKGKDIARGTLYKILKDAGISYEKFKKLK